MNTQDIYISGRKTSDDWLALKKQLLAPGNISLWQDAYQDYFLERLNLRYLSPIKILQENGSFEGEGFSIMAILCTLVEFLESTAQGMSYRYTRDSKTLGPYEYSNSQSLFEGFLCNRTPFSAHFDKDLAVDFYKNIRCGLLHEAQTKNGWRIWAENCNGQLVDKGQKIIYRNNFEEAFRDFIKSYGKDLTSDEKLQAAFVRKFDSLCS